MSTRRRLAAALVSCAVAFGFAPAALACGGLFCQNTPVDQAGEKILFASDGQTVTAHVQIQYKGDAKNFSWVVPVPTAPTLSVGSDNLFTALRNATRPQFNLQMDYEQGCQPPPMAEDAAAGAAPAPTGATNGVTVVSQDTVGPYDTAVITADDPGALKKWLKDNDYILPPKLDPLLDPYVAGKYYFVALKLTKDKSAGDIQPIVMKYAATKPGIPIRLTGVAATPDMDVYVWVLGNARAIPENYRHAIINEAKIDWLSAGRNYRDVVTEAMNEAGGQAFVTDFAGDSTAVSADTFDPARFDVDSLAGLTEPVAFAQAIVDKGYFGERFNGLDTTALVSFLKRYIPKPESLASTDDPTFYRNLTDYKDQLAAAQETVDTGKAIAELREKVVKPYADIQHMFQASPYLTALYTTMSPEEMTQDPTFRFNSDLPKVSNVHTAKGIRRCSLAKDPQSFDAFFNAPVEITLTDGRKFLATNASYDENEHATLAPAVAALPAALRIEQLKPVGGPSLIADNSGGAATPAGTSPIPSTTGSAAASAAPASAGPGSSPAASHRPTTRTIDGFSCSGCSSNNAAPRTSDGGGEGLAYALVVLGFWGYRRRLRRR